MTDIAVTHEEFDETPNLLGVLKREIEITTVANAAFRQAARVADALRISRDPLAVAIVAKCVATAAADPRFRTPTK